MPVDTAELVRQICTMSCDVQGTNGSIKRQELVFGRTTICCDQRPNDESLACCVRNRDGEHKVVQCQSLGDKIEESAMLA